MDMIMLGDVTLHYRVEGDPGGMPVVFANSLGTDFRLWDKVIPMLPDGLKILRFDKRGHGLSSCPGDDYRMEELVDDTERLLQALGFEDCLFVGLSIGGLIAQGLAARQSDLLRAMVISNSATRIGSEQMWRERIENLYTGGVEALADNIMERWFSDRFRQQHGTELLAWRNMLTRTPLQGYIGCCKAIATTDFEQTSSALKLPTLVIAGAEDGSAPPEIVRATADLIEGAQYELLDTGHLPCVEQPETYARILGDFIREKGYA
jgi:3-oxoadipate enol-lactonase